MINVVTPESVGFSEGRLARIPPHFDRYVDDGKFPGYQVLVARRGEIAYFHQYGLRDVESDLPVEEDTIYRIFSMTKPITSVALLQLYEQGVFQLDDPVSDYIPQFKDLPVFASGDERAYEVRPADREVTIRDLLTHTAGFSYGSDTTHPVDKLYAEQDLRGGTLQEMIDKLAKLPLLYSPGTHWHYSYATDVLGYLIEVLAGQTLDRYFAEQIFEPLGMPDTAFAVSDDKRQRFAANYDYVAGKDGHDSIARISAGSPIERKYSEPVVWRSGGGGLVSTAADYVRFAQMLLNKGALDGEQILGRKTVELMTCNHLPNNADITSMLLPGNPAFARDGVGFGLGGSVLLDPAKSQILGSRGEYSWGGAASTAFWIDPVEELTVVFLTQLMPSSTYPLRRGLRVLTYQALVDA